MTDDQITVTDLTDKGLHRGDKRLSDYFCVFADHKNAQDETLMRVFLSATDAGTWGVTKHQHEAFKFVSHEDARKMGKQLSKACSDAMKLGASKGQWTPKAIVLGVMGYVDSSKQKEKH